MRVKLHVFSNGNMIFEFDNNITPSVIDHFRTQFLASPPGALMFQGVELSIVEHMNPMWLPEKKIDVDQDQQA